MASALARYHMSLQRRRYQEKSHELERKVGNFLAGAAIAALEPHVPAALGPIPLKPAFSIICAWGATATSGSARRYLNIVADASAAIYGYAAAKNKTLVAGEEF
jgi:hypothetical protein